ncbi:WD domain, G-beta repeat family protein [Clavispora lusitaniae]|uniref:WD domain, G-beta repeat family protein n=1 Tax=Clavispora lusitaniae TaxID=36911 RepID=UPI00202BCCD7|nr:WD domain, G-beta repeat family protein [Clavispora lusitaniae]
MVKSYDRYEQESSFGVIGGQSNIVWLPPAPTQSSKSLGRAASGGLEDILIWDIKTGELMTRLNDDLTPGASNAKTSSAPSTVIVLAYHEQTNILAAGHNDGTIKIWDLTSGSVMVTFSGHKSAISVLKFDRNGTRVVSGSADSTVIMWDLVGEEGLFKLKGHKSQITGMHLLSQMERTDDELEDYLVTVSKDGLIKLWELKSKQCVETHLAHSGECWALGLNSGKDMLITCGSKDQVKVWEIDLDRDDGSKIVSKGEFEKQSKARCTDIGFTSVRDASGTYEIFALQNADRTTEVFRVRSSEEIKKGITKRTKRLKDKGFEEDEILQSLRESEISMLITPFTTVRTTSKVKSCVWVPSNRKNLDLLLALTNNSIEFHNIPLPEQIRKAQVGDIHSVKAHTIDNLGHRTDIRAMDVSDDNKLLATASNGELKVWNIRSHNVLRTFSLEGGYALCCKFLPGGTLVVVGFKNGDLELYDLASSSLIDRVENAHENTSFVSSGTKDDNGSAIWSMDLTPDGKTLVTGGNDKKVKFWNFKVSQEIVAGTSTVVSSLKLAHTQTLEVTDEVLSVKVSPDSKFLAISLLNNNVQVVFYDSLKLFLTLYGHKLPVLSIDISFDNKLIITSSADKNIKIWGLDFGDCHKSIFGHQDSIMNVRFIPESHNFFSSGKDGMIKYWDGDKFQCIQKLPAHQSEVWALSVSRDGSFVVSTSHDHSIRVWSATNDQVFLEEEREKEMDELYENELLESLEGDDVTARKDEDGEEDEQDGVASVRKQTMETLKAGEKLMEALDIGVEDLDNVEQYELQLQQYQSKKPGAFMPTKPTPNSILVAFGVTGQEYVLNTMLKIRSTQLEDALLVLPFSYTVKLMRFISIWTNKQNITNNIVNLSLICKVLFFVMRTNAKELVSQRDEKLRNYLVEVKTQLRGKLVEASKQLGYNTEGLRFKRNQWKLNHETEFIDEAEQREYEEKKAVKRTFATV